MSSNNTVALHSVKGISDSTALHHYLESQQNPIHIRLGEYLVKSGVASTAEIEAACKVQALTPRKRLGEILVEQSVLDAAVLTAVLHELMGIPHINLAGFDFDAMALNVLPGELARQHQVVPLIFFHNELVIAAATIPDHKTLQFLTFTCKHTVFVVIAESQEIARAIDVHYDTLDESLQGTDVILQAREEDDRNWRDEEFQAKQQPIVKLVNSMILDGIVRRASDIHLRPGVKDFELLYRVDGTLLSARKIDKRLLPAVVSRLKIVSGLNIAERRAPQDGHMRVVAEHENTIDMRVSIIPTQHGESVVIRILNKNAGMRQISEIGFAPDDEAMFRDLIGRSAGILLVTGPTGSGKTTTLYAALQEVKKEMVNVVTVEDPIEYQLEGMLQIQLQEAIGFGFPQTLRHILRHDPDIIMVGEIRDQETAKVALDAALTGHLVFSTLHTNDAPGAVIRLQEMGMSPHLIKTAVIGVIGQRLIRLNCPHCKTEEVVSPVIRRNLHLDASEIFQKGAGCEHCHSSGFAGRAAIYEMFVINDEVRCAIRDGMTSAELREIAINSGMRPLIQHGLEYARAGKASLTEVYRASM